MRARGKSLGVPMFTCHGQALGDGNALVPDDHVHMRRHFGASGCISVRFRRLRVRRRGRPGYRRRKIFFPNTTPPRAPNFNVGLARADTGDGRTFRGHFLINIEIRGKGDIVHFGAGKNIFRLPSAMCVSPISDVLVWNMQSTSSGRLGWSGGPVGWAGALQDH